jgi:hypothetical protein
MTIVLNGTTGITTPGTDSTTLTVNANNISAVNSLGFRNRIINGNMVIDQRNAGASTAPTDAYTLDRWEIREDTDGAITCQQVADAPSGFVYSAKITTTTADASLSATQRLLFRQPIEGNNFADLAFGSASAANVTLSFWVKSSLTGTFGGALTNSGSARSYPFTYTISAANTWEQKTVTVAGDTSGTWLTTNGVGLNVYFGLGVGSDYSGTAGSWATATRYSATGAVSVIGTLSATWQITGVQLEAGSVASPFERRDYGRELALCQRYFYMIADGANKSLGLGTMFSATNLQGAVFFPVTMRATPTLSATTGTNFYEFLRNNSSDGFDSLSIGNRTSTTVGEIQNTTEVSGTVGHSGFIRTDNATVKVSFSSEL